MGDFGRRGKGGYGYGQEEKGYGHGPGSGNGGGRPPYQSHSARRGRVFRQGRGGGRQYQSVPFDYNSNHNNNIRREEGMRGGRGRGQQQQPSLTNFFSFPSAPLPKFDPMPQRWTEQDRKRKEEEKEEEDALGSEWDDQRKSFNARTTTFLDDDNKDYVEHYRKNIEARITNLQIRLEDRDECERRSSVTTDDESLLGTVPVPGGSRENANDDAEVFWKYKMDERTVDTTHLRIKLYENEVIRLLEFNQVVVVEGFTGCGKTTQVPQFILDMSARTCSRVKIVVTQPRRIAAISVANRVCEERGWPLGSLVGYQVGMDRKTSDDTRVTYMTTGVLLQLLISKKNLSDYTHIIIDEVHERDLDTDLLLLVIKKIMVDRMDADTKIILMSATLDSKKFLDYFPVLRRLNHDTTPAVVSVQQPPVYEVKENYLDEIVEKYGMSGFGLEGADEPKVFAECYELACRIILSLDYFEYLQECKSQNLPVENMTDEERKNFMSTEFFKAKNGNIKAPPRGAVLVFLPGFAEIDALYKELEDITLQKAGSYNKQNVTKWTILPLHSTVTAEEQQRVFKPAPTGYRKIILATNIAESSITVPDIRYVIDFCLTKCLSCDSITNYTCLRMEWASRNQCIQRRGRCGRVAPGICYRLINRNFYDVMAQEALPEMEKASLESVILNVKTLGMGTPLEVLAHAIDPPKQSGIGRAVANLKEVGALTLAIGGVHNAYDGELTYMGEVMARLPIDFRLGRLIVLGHVFGCVDDAVIIAAGLSTKSPFSSPYNKRLEAWLSKFGWSNRTYSDCFALLNSFNNWAMQHRDQKFRSFTEERKWARDYYIQLSVIREIANIVEEIKKRLENEKVQIFPDAYALSGLERGLMLKLVIAGAFYPNFFYRSRPTKKEYEKELIKQAGGFNPLHTVVLQGFPIDLPGPLYAKHIADRLQYANCIPQVNFSSSKVFVTFDPRGDKVGAISYGVYRAVKMQKLRERLVFYTLPREDSKKAMLYAQEFLKGNPILRAPKGISLPSIRENEFECFVSHVSETESPHEFYVIRKSEAEVCTMLEELIQNEMEEAVSNSRVELLTDRQCQPGALCLIMKKKKFLRGRIEAINNERALVYTIDLGMSAWIEFQYLMKFPQRLIDRGAHTIPAMAMPCRLSEVKASCRHAHDWGVDACKDFLKFIGSASNDLLFRVYSVVEGVIAGELINPRTQQSITDIFMKRTFLEKSYESQDSKENNRQRRLWNILRYEDSLISAFDRNQEAVWEPSRYPVPPNLTEETGKEIVLRGPSSPLEMDFTSLCYSAHMKQVQIEGSSINCATLDTEPFHACSRVLVAASVGVAHRSGNILARETTMMPPIPGLLSLLTLVFAPRVEFRANQDHSAYTGCVSGLGTDPKDNATVYPDHDMEVIFDVKIDNEDLNIINSIRMTFNMLLRNCRNFSTSQALREKLRMELSTLLQREREEIEETWPEETHAWNQLTGAELCNPSDSVHTREDDVFSLHTGIVLKRPRDGPNGIIPRNVFQA